MKRLKTKMLEELLAEMGRAAAQGPAAWDPWHDAHCQPACVEAPQGELFNERITGFLWAGQMLGTLDVGLRIEGNESFNSNGLEGKFRMHTDLIATLLMWQEMPPYRCNVYLAE